MASRAARNRAGIINCYQLLHGDLLTSILASSRPVASSAFTARARVSFFRMQLYSGPRQRRDRKSPIMYSITMSATNCLDEGYDLRLILPCPTHHLRCLSSHNAFFSPLPLERSISRRGIPAQMHRCKNMLDLANVFSFR